jgi:hypothetical protein
LSPSLASPAAATAAIFVVFGFVFQVKIFILVLGNKEEEET